MFRPPADADQSGLENAVQDPSRLNRVNVFIISLKLNNMHPNVHVKIRDILTASSPGAAEHCGSDGQSMPQSQSQAKIKIIIMLHLQICKSSVIFKWFISTTSWSS